MRVANGKFSDCYLNCEKMTKTTNIFYFFLILLLKGIDIRYKKVVK